MKKKWIVLFIMMSLVCQLSVFALLNWKTEELLNPFFRFDKVNSINTDLRNAHSMSLSYNNRYLAFMNGDVLQVYDLISKQIVFNAQTLPEAKSVLKIKWLPDRNNLICVTKNTADTKDSVSLYSLDFDAFPGSNSAIPVEPRLDRVINLSMLQILSMEMSTYTNNLFILYQDQDLQSRLISIDIMKNINRLDDPGEKIHSMAVSNKFGIIYTDSEKERHKTVWAMNGRERKSVTDDPREVLLGCSNEVLFTGKLSNNELREILVYTFDSSGSPQKKLLWQGNTLYQSTEILISSDRKVFLLYKDYLEVIYPDGRQVSKKIPSNHSIVLSPTGMMYMELTPQTNEFTWRAV